MASLDDERCHENHGHVGASASRAKALDRDRGASAPHDRSIRALHWGSCPGQAQV